MNLDVSHGACRLREMTTEQVRNSEGLFKDKRQLILITKNMNRMLALQAAFAKQGLVKLAEWARSGHSALNGQKQLLLAQMTSAYPNAFKNVPIVTRMRRRVTVGVNNIADMVRLFAMSVWADSVINQSHFLIRPFLQVCQQLYDNRYMMRQTLIFLAPAMQIGATEAFKLLWQSSKHPGFVMTTVAGSTVLGWIFYDNRNVLMVSPVHKITTDVANKFLNLVNTNKHIDNDLLIMVADSFLASMTPSLYVKLVSGEFSTGGTSQLMSDYRSVYNDVDSQIPTPLSHPTSSNARRNPNTSPEGSNRSPEVENRVVNQVSQHNVDTLKKLHNNWKLTDVQRCIFESKLPEGTRKKACMSAMLTTANNAGITQNRLRGHIFDEAKKERQRVLPRTRVMNRIRESWLLPGALKPHLIRAVVAAPSTLRHRLPAKRRLEALHAKALLNNIQLSKLKSPLRKVATLVQQTPSHNNNTLLSAPTPTQIRSALLKEIANRQKNYEAARFTHRVFRRRPDRLLPIVQRLKSAQLLAGMHAQRGL